MKIISQQNPIIINRVRVNDDSQYLSADGINVVLNTSAKTKAFQDWMDKNNAGWVKGKNLNKGSGYGTNGPSTQQAWLSFGDAFLSESKNLMGFGVQPSKTTAEKAGKVFDKAKGVWVKADELGLVDKGFQILGLNRPGQSTQPANEIGNVGSASNTPPPAEKKSMSTGVKIAIGVGALALVGTIVYFVMKGKKKGK